jgi:hypothetical protein
VTQVTRLARQRQEVLVVNLLGSLIPAVPMNESTTLPDVEAIPQACDVQAVRLLDRRRVRVVLELQSIVDVAGMIDEM